MGRLLLVFRLAWRDIRHHLAEALLLVVAIATASATLTMALALSGVTAHPYQQTREATKGPDVVAYLTSPGSAASLVHAPGVAASSGPYPVVSALIHVHGHTARSLSSASSSPPNTTSPPRMVSSCRTRSRCSARAPSSSPCSRSRAWRCSSGGDSPSTRAGSAC